MGTRIELQALFESILGNANAYFQPPSNEGMSFPAIVYNRDFEDKKFADDIPYARTKRYQVIVIDKDPDSVIPDKIGGLPMSTFVRHFVADSLNHDIYYLYF